MVPDKYIYIYVCIEIVTYIDIVTRVNLQAEVIVSALVSNHFKFRLSLLCPSQHALASVIICAPKISLSRVLMFE